MGRGDNRSTAKMLRKRSQEKLKARITKRKEDAAAKPAAPASGRASAAARKVEAKPAATRVRKKKAEA